jgi:hypothetical protein
MNKLKPAVVEQLRELFRSGASVRQAAAAAHVDKNTAAVYFRNFCTNPRKVVYQSALPQLTDRERMAVRTRRMQMQRRAKRRQRQSIAELRAIVEASPVPITRFPPGAHKGWRPSWIEHTAIT